MPLDRLQPRSAKLAIKDGDITEEHPQLGYVRQGLRQLSLYAATGLTSESEFTVPRYIAVGTPIAERPPHKTERAQFRHSASTLGE